MNRGMPMENDLYPLNLQNGASGHWLCNGLSPGTQQAVRHGTAVSTPLWWH